jgi:hypothetical protein
VAAWLQPDPLEAGNRPGRKSRRTLRSRPGGGQPYLPPPTTLGAPWGSGCPLPPKKHVRSCRTSSTLQHHSPVTSDFRKRRPPGRCSSDCDLQLQCRLAQVEPLAGAIWHRRHRRYDSARHGDDDDTTTTMPDPCSESVPPRGGEGVLNPQASRRGEHMGRVGFDARSFFPWDGRSLVSHPTGDVPFPPRRTGRYWKGMISAHPSYQGFRRSVWDPETFAPGLSGF